MNDHLIRKLKISLLLGVLRELLIGGVLIYFFNIIQPIEWYVWLICLIYPMYSMVKNEKIILEIIKEEDNFTIKSYSILQGKQDLKLHINNIIELDFFRGFLIKHQSNDGKISDTFQINAEPWNTIYEQIKQLKLAEQEVKKLSAKNFNLKAIE